MPRATTRSTPALAAGVLRACALTAALLLLLLVAGAGPASAHATLIGTDPAEGEVLPESPEQVVLTFDETVSLTSDGVLVFDAAGEPVEAESSSADGEVTASLPDLDDGTYVVTYRVVSADGHPIAGSLTFSVGAPSETVADPGVSTEPPGSTRVVLGVVQGAAYLGLLLATGLVLFTARVLSGVRVPPATRARLSLVLRAALGTALVAWVLRVPVVAAYRQGTGLDGILTADVLDLGVVGTDLLVLALVVAGLVTALVTHDRGGRAGLVALAGAALAVAAPALVGHTRVFDPEWLLVVTDVVHLGAGAVWLGGLVGLVLTLTALAGRAVDVASVLARFSALAAASLGLLAVTGTLLVWRILGSVSGLVDTTYGRVLLVKVAVVALVAAVAGVNRWRLLPRTRDAVGHDDLRRAAAGVRRAVRVEALLLVGVVGLTGFLVDQPPRPVADAAGTAADLPQAQLGDLQVLVALTPGAQGPNRLTVQVQDAAGEPLDVYAAPEVSVGNDTVDLGALTLVPVGAGTYTADLVLPAPGEWEAQVSLRTSEFDNPVTTVVLTAR